VRLGCIATLPPDCHHCGHDGRSQEQSDQAECLQAAEDAQENPQEGRRVGARAVFLEWRDELAQTSLRQADYAYGTLSRILSWARNRGLIAVNPCAKGGKLYHGTRVDKIWDDEQVARILQLAPPYLQLAMLLAINTGQRQG
jgi:hypothetical protein